MKKRLILCLGLVIAVLLLVCTAAGAAAPLTPQKVNDRITAGGTLSIEEEKAFLAELNLPDCYFWAVHPLDSVKIEGWLRDDQQRMLDALTWNIEHVKDHTIQRTSRVGTL